MSRKRSPLETLEVIERSAEEDEAERILALSDEELERELAGAGFDLRAVRAKGQALAERLGVNTSSLEAPANDAPAGEPSAEPAAWVTQAAPPRRATPAARWAMLLAAALAAAATGGGVLYALAHRPKPNDKPVELPREVPTVTPPAPPPPQDTRSAPRTEPQKPYGDMKDIPPRDIKNPR